MAGCTAYAVPDRDPPTLSLSSFASEEGKGERVSDSSLLNLMVAQRAIPTAVTGVQVEGAPTGCAQKHTVKARYPSSEYLATLFPGSRECLIRRGKLGVKTPLFLLMP